MTQNQQKAKAPRVDADLYQALLSAFRDKPNNVQNAADQTNVNWKTADRAWRVGWPRRGWAPIEAVLKQEQLQARRMLEVERQAKIAAEQKEKETARADAVQARKEEGQVVKLARGAALRSLITVTELARNAGAWNEILKGRLEIERDKAARWIAYEKDVLNGVNSVPPVFDRPVMSLDGMLNVLNRAADYTGKITACARQAMEMERLYLGEPTEIIKTIEETREITLAEAQMVAESAIQALQGSEVAGGLKLVSSDGVPVIGKRVIPQ